MAESSAKPADGPGRGRAGRKPASTARSRAARPKADPDATMANPVLDDGDGRFDTGSGPQVMPTGPIPRHVPPEPGGVLPTTRRGMLRYRVLPRTVVGLSMLILAFAIGAGFSGVVLFSYYQYKQNQADDKVSALVNGYNSKFSQAESALNADVSNAKAEIANQLKNVQALQAGPTQLAALIKQLAPSVFFVHTLDAAGQPSVGTAFVISSNSGQSLLVTSYTTVQAATRAPGPPVYVSQGDSGAQSTATLKTWDAQYDLAVLSISKGGLTALTAAPTSPAQQPGDVLFAVSGLGSAGASLAQGSVVDVSSNGLQLDAPIGAAFQGGPIVNQSGQVVAVGSRSYAPLGFTSDATFFVPYVETACNKVLSCPGGTLVGAQ